MKKIILGLDMDGCLYDWHSAVYTHFISNNLFDGTYYEFWKWFVEVMPHEKQEYYVSLPILYECVAPSPSVLEFLDFASKNADEIYYITHRPSSAELVTRRYMRRYEFPSQDNLYLTGDKATACRAFKVTHFLDDHIKHVKAVSGIADVFLMAKQWNFGSRDGYNVVYGIQDFKRQVFT